MSSQRVFWFHLNVLHAYSHNDTDDRDSFCVCVSSCGWANGLEMGAGVTLYAFRNGNLRSEAEL